MPGIRSHAAHEASAELTESLRQAMQMMSSEIERSTAAAQTLSELVIITLSRG
jgi:hypothetical protein